MKKAAFVHFLSQSVGMLPALLLLSSCAGSLRSKPVAAFPSLAALNQIAAVPAAPPTLAAAAVPAGGWTVDASHAAQTAYETWQPADPWGRAFASALALTGRPVRRTRAMSCVAQELVRFRLETKKEPPPALRQFILGACGAVGVQLGSQGLSGSIPATVPDEEVLKQWNEKLGTELVGQLPQDTTEVGFGFGRSGDQVIALVSYSQSRDEIQPFSLLPDERGNIVLEGRVAGEVEYFTGYINQGRFGVASCQVDLGVPKPRFRVFCHMAPADRSAWVQIAYAQPRRVLNTSVLEVLIRRTPTEVLAYTESAPAAAPPVNNAEKFSRAVLTELNAVRAKAQLAPVQLAAAQSATSLRVAGHYFNAALGKGRESEMDQIALGLVAGWEVEGMIRHANFFSQLVPHTWDPSVWLDTSLALPHGRLTLLAANVDQIAVGPLLLSNPEGLGAVVTGFELHHGNDHTQDVEHLFERLCFARERLGLGPPRKMAELSELISRELARVHAGQREPRELMSEVLQRGSEALGLSLRGYVIETTSLEALEIPPEVIKQPGLQIAMGVTHHKPVGGAWAQLTIVVVYVNSVLPGV